MKSFFAFALAATVTFSLSAATEIQTTGASVGQWTMDAPAALSLAKETQKPVFLCFTGSDWCGWCKLMDKNIFSTDTWKDYAKENMVLVWIDSPRDKTLVPEEIAARNKELCKQYKIEGYPTYVILSADGEEIGRLSASREYTPETFIKDYEKVLIKLRLEELLTAEVYADYLATKKEIDAIIEKADKETEAYRQRMKGYQAEVSKLVEKLEAIEESVIK